MRLFIALTLPPPVRHHLSRFEHFLKPHTRSLRWTTPENLHLTLKFLGPTPDQSLPSLCSALSAIPKTPSPITLTPGRLICFPPQGPIRILAADLTGTLEPLATVHDQIQSACASLGFPIEHRPFHPHITLARAQTPLPAPMRSKLPPHTSALPTPPSFTPTHFTLLESRPTPTGSQYNPVASFPL